MECPNCHFGNPEGTKFCGECGNKLEIPCPACGFSNPPQFKFCGECGHDLRKPKETPLDYAIPTSYTPGFLADKILTNRGALEGERKIVTILFADVAGFTSLSEKLDAEDIHKIMDGCFRILLDKIHEHEGTVNQFTGDGVMAIFGAPVAHENHAQRACHAALAIQKAMTDYGGKIKNRYGLDFRLRIGLNSGQVIVGSIGDDLRMDYTAQGDTVNLAARMESSADAGNIRVTAHTYRLARYFFNFKSLGKIQVKGKAEPQQAYQLLETGEAETRLEASVAKGLTKLVGRGPEMETLRSALEKIKEKSAQVIDVVGEAGVGKSRLVYEFRKTIGSDANFLTGICTHYGRNINFLPIIGLVRQSFLIDEGMTEEEARHRIRKKAGKRLKSMVPFYENLLSLKVDDPMFNSLNPEGRKFGTFEAVKDMLLARSENQPLVVFIEDVHWIDKISEELLTFFSHCIKEHPILMLTAYRPEAAPPWAKGSCYQRLGLETLSSSSSIHLVHNVLGGVPLDPALEQKIADKAEGNSFFIEEVVGELLDRGDIFKSGDRYISNNPIGRLNIPDTIQGVLAGRMDRLSEDLKYTMQVASVIGRDFAFKLLKGIMDLGDELRNHLNNLVGLEILYEKALYPELEYIFKHAFTQEVAYESMLKQRRRELHGRIAGTIEEVYANKLDQHCELLAHHWELSDDPEKAVEYLVLAGEKSLAVEAANSAADFFTRALSHLEKSNRAPDPASILKIRLNRAEPLRLMGRIEESFVDYTEAIKLARELEDNQAELECLTQVGFLTYNTRMKDQTPAYCEQGLKLARSLSDKGTESRIKLVHAYWRYLWQLSDEYQAFRESLALAEESGQPSAIVQTRMMMSVLERWNGNAREALRLLEGLSEMLQSRFNASGAGGVSMAYGWALTDLGKYTEAIKFQKHWIEIFKQNSNFFVLGRTTNGLGWTHSEIYDLESAVQFNELALENVNTLRKSPASVYAASEQQAHAEVNLMENRFEMGKPNDAWQHITRFEGISDHPDYDMVRERWTNRMKLLKGEILLCKGDLTEAERLARECLDPATKRSLKKYIGKSERLLGRILTERKTFDPAEQNLKSALNRLEEVGNPKQLWLTRTALARLYRKMKRLDLEREQWQAASAIVQTTAEDLQDPNLEKIFTTAAPVQEILKNSK